MIGGMLYGMQLAEQPLMLFTAKGKRNKHSGLIPKSSLTMQESHNIASIEQPSLFIEGGVQGLARWINQHH
ncbi:hypothetical protein SESBI_29466 [Sesbania bispinosa]|nr:hypothetical protein SESBI_29466 [Sesbania bispinosa]